MWVGEKRGGGCNLGKKDFKRERSVEMGRLKKKEESRRKREREAK